MADHHERGVSSTAAIAGHPIHPILIPFPIAFLIGAFITDITFWWGGEPFWGRVSFWLVAAGFVTGVLAAIAGLVDFLTIDRAREHTAGWVHFLGNVVVIILALVNFLLRLDGVADVIVPSGLILSGLTTAILAVTGWYGGELSYRHQIGVIDKG